MSKVVNADTVARSWRIFEMRQAEKKVQKLEARLASENRTIPKVTTTHKEQSMSISKRAEETLALVEKRVNNVLMKGAVSTVVDAYNQVFRDDPELYEDYRKASVARDPLPRPEKDGMQKAAVSSAYQEAQRLAAQMKKDDVYGKYTDKTETEMISAVFAERPDLYRLYRDEVLSQK